MPNQSEEFELEESEQFEELRHILLKPDMVADEISPYIAQILEKQIHESKDNIAQALAPVIGEALRRQVYESRADIIDALYPIIGQTINKAMTEAVADLARNIDARIRRDPLQNLNARLKGLSPEEYKMRMALPFTVKEIFLIHRETGLLIRHLSLESDEADADGDLISGMLTAIRDFTQESFGRGKEGDLDSIEYGDQQIMIQSGKAAYIAVVIEGTAPAGFRDDIRAYLLALHEKHYNALLHFDGLDEGLYQNSYVVLYPLLQQGEVETQKEALSKFQKVLLFSLLLILILPPILAVLGGYTELNRV